MMSRTGLTLAGQQAHGNAALEAARHYAALGYPAFPLAPGEKRPHPRLAPHGFRDASQDPARLEAWWRQDPRAGVGIAPGPSVLVLDADSPEALEALQERWPELKAAPLQRTPRGGGHLFVSVPEEVGRAITTRAKALDGLADIKGLGRSYLAAWPTCLPNGCYRWERPLVSPSELPEAPASLVAALLPPPPKPPESAWKGAGEVPQKRLEGLLAWACEEVANTPEGQRHNRLLALARLMGGYCHLGLDPEAVAEALARAGVEAGLPWREALATAKDGVRYGMAAPLDLEDPAPIYRKPMIFRNGLAENPGPSLSQKTIFRNPALHIERAVAVAEKEEEGGGEVFRSYTALELPTQTEIAWLWEGFIAQGTLALLAGPGGVGKSTLVAALEVAVAAGLPFLEAEVAEGEVLHVDFDTDRRLQGPWYRKVARGLGVEEEVLKRVQYLEPANPHRGLDGKALKALLEAARQGPRLIVLDSWSAAFPYLDMRRAEHVAERMAYLKEIAASGPSLLILDHTPKPVQGLSALERGVLGSVYKVAGVRSAFLLGRVPPKLTGGEDVLRLDTLKNNLAPLGDPLGVRRVWEDGALRFEVTELPEEEGRASKRDKAARAVLEVLEDGPKGREELIRLVAERANAAKRTIEEVLRSLVAKGAIERLALGGRGGPVAFRLPQAPATSPVCSAELRKMDFADNEGPGFSATRLRKIGGLREMGDGTPWPGGLAPLEAKAEGEEPEGGGECLVL